MKRLAAAILLIAGCTPGKPAASCDPPPASFGSWRDFGYSIDGPHVNRIALTPDGGLRWNSEALHDTAGQPSYATLDRYLTVTAQLTPMPATTLVYARGIPCFAVRRVRAMMERRLACAPTSAVCLQGPGPDG